VNTDIETIEKCKPILTIINLPGINSTSEIYGPLGKELLSHLRIVDRLICDLISIVEKIYDDYLFIALADQGIVPIKENINLNEVLKELNVVFCASHRAAHIYALSNLKEVIRRLKEVEGLN